MANSSVVGILKVLLTANTAEFETAMKGVGKDLDKLGGKAFDISGLIGKIGPALVGAFTIGAITKVVGNFVEASGALVDLEAKTGLSVTALQKLKGATEQSGVSLETVAAASLALSKRLGEGKESTVGALTELGLKYAEIRKLSPEDQFFKVGDALGKIGDQNKKVELTNDLLGKQGQQLLPALNGELQKTADAYEKLGLVMDEKVVRAGDDLGDSWTVLKSLGGALIAQVLGPMVQVLGPLVQGMIALAPAVGNVSKGFLTLIGYPFKVALVDPLLAVAAAVDTVIVAWTGLGNLPDIKPPTITVPEVTGPKKLSPDEYKDIDRELTASAQEAIRKNKEAHKAALVDRTEATRAFYNWLGEREIQAVADNQARLDAQAAAWRDYYNFLGERRMEDEAAQMRAAAPLVNTLQQAFVPLKAAVQAQGPDLGMHLGSTLIGGLEKTFRTQLGPTIMSAITGGGNIGQAIGGLLGQSITGSLAQSLTSAFPKFMSGFLGQTIGSLLPGVGALLGPLLDKVFGMFGVSKEIKAARGELEGFQKDLRANLSETQRQEAGTEGWRQDVIAVRDAYLATGRTAAEAEAIVKQMWDTDNPARSKTAIEQINRVLEEQGRIAANNEAAADAAADAQEEAAAARARELDDLKGRLADLRDEATVDFEDMAAAAKRFGIDVDSLGPKFQGERIAAGAQDIVDTFDMLTENGADVGAVLFGMREEINDLVKNALKFGTTLPANMQPWIRELIRSGNLVDDNGEALTDVSRLQFGAPVESKLDRVNSEIEQVTQKIEELSDAIVNDLIAAFEKIPENINISFDLTFNDPAVPGGITLTPRVPGLAEGGIVTAPTLALIGEGSRPEAVIPLDRLRDSGIGGGRIVVLPFIPITDPYLAAEEAARQFQRRVGGDSHGMREVIEQVIDDWMRTYSPVRA